MFLPMEPSHWLGTLNCQECICMLISHCISVLSAVFDRLGQAQLWKLNDWPKTLTVGLEEAQNRKEVKKHQGFSGLNSQKLNNVNIRTYPRGAVIKPGFGYPYKGWAELNLKKKIGPSLLTFILGMLKARTYIYICITGLVCRLLHDNAGEGLCQPNYSPLSTLKIYLFFHFGLF